MAVFPYAHDRTYYESLVFGGGSLHSLSGNTSAQNVNAYFQAMSSGNFRFSNEGTYEVAWSNWVKSRMKVDGNGQPDSFYVADMVHMLESAGFNFQAYDSNRDGRVSNEELAILAFHNFDQTNGMNRAGPEPGGCTTLVKSALKVCSRVAFLAQQTDFETLTHELSHSLGTVDLYGAWNKECLSYGMTLMSCTLGKPPDDMHSVRLDPWHLHMLGWLSYQDYGVGDYRLGPGYAAAVFRNPVNPHEYYIFESRQQFGLWDSGMASFGVVAWHVRETAEGYAYNADGRPYGHSIYVVSLDTPIGGSRAWSPSDGVFRLKWENGNQLLASFQVKASTIPGVGAILTIKHESPNGISLFF